MGDIKASNFGGIPFGNTANRPTAEIGKLYSNGEEKRLELYTSGGWQNIVQETPGIVSISGVYNESSATNTIQINGTNFTAGAVVYAVGTNGADYVAQSTTINGIDSATAVFAGLSSSYEPYDIKIVNPSNLYGQLDNVLYVNQTPIWSTASGTLGSFVELSSVSVSVSATDPEGTSLVYSSSNLPGWLSLNSSTGTLTGTAPSITSSTTYSFNISVTDGVNSSSRAFSMYVTDRAPTWSTSTSLPDYSINVAYSTTLVATDDSGISPTYSTISGSLPPGLSLNSSSGVISGTPTSSTNYSFTVRATDNGSSYVDRTFTLNNAGPSWTTASGSLGVAYGPSYSYQLVASDDNTSLTYSVVSGSLPPSFTMSSSGLISGVPASGGVTYTFTTRITDSNSSYSDRSFSITNGISIIATGGTEYTSGGYKYHKFTGTGNFVVSQNTGNVPAIDILLVAGGGSGGNDVGAGGGAGGVWHRASVALSPATYPVTVGAGQPLTNAGELTTGGSDTTFNNLFTAFGGGGGATWNPGAPGRDGGSGGGGAGYSGSYTAYGNSIQTNNNSGTGYGNRGGSPSSNFNSGGGGGAGAVGGNGTGAAQSGSVSGNGGIGTNLFSAYASATSSGDSGYFAGGGGGGTDYTSTTPGSGGLGGGGAGSSASGAAGTSGTVNTGGGGGGAQGYPGGAGGSGIVIVRYPV